MRRPIIAGNWKMHKTAAEGALLASDLRTAADVRSDVDVLVCPPYTALASVVAACAGSRVMVGAQDVFWKTQGAYTSQVSPGMLLDLGVTYAIIGHSETRGRFGVPEEGFDADVLRHFGETDRTVNLKLHAALTSGLRPICCIGETLAEREAGQADAVVSQQTAAALSGVSADQAKGLIFAYEPVWAIGTGKVCDAPEADRICGVVRATVARLYGAATAESVRVQYGGSVKADNAADLLGRPNIDGALVGGASLKAPDFCAIVEACPLP